MRVLMTADTIGSVWSYAMDLCRALADSDVEVTLATMGPPPSAAQQREAAALPRVTIHCSDFAAEWMDEPWHDVARAGQWLLSLARSVKPHVVHLNGYTHAALPWSAPVLVVAHSCIYSWWHAVKGEEPPAQYASYQRAVARGLRRADRVVAPNRTLLSALGTHYGAPQRGAVVHNGCSSSRFASGPKGPIVLSAGRVWDDAKNMAALDAVAPSLSWTVRVAGPTTGPRGEALALRRATALGILGRSEMARELAGASIFALPARYSPSGISVLEAAMSGCALVLGDIPSLRELWDGAALFVPPDDRAALQESLARLIADSRERRRLADAARQRAGEYPIERTAGQYLRLYHVLAGFLDDVPVTESASRSSVAPVARAMDQARA